jgi:uncharacterized membrane protein YqaE (UPF0057 family)
LEPHGHRPHHPRHHLPAARRLFAGRVRVQFWIKVLLTLLGYNPGIIHALWVILRT